MDHDAMLDRYADLALEVGVGHRAGQRVLLRSPLVAAPLARRIAAAAYRRGAPYVHVVWSDDEVTRTRYLEAPADSFEEMPPFEADAMRAMAERGDAIVTIDASDPELLRDADPARVATARAARQRAMKPFSRVLMADGTPWTIVAVPTSPWAAKAFPDVPADEAVARLWAAVFAAVRLDRDDPVAAWREHVDALEARARTLNAARFAALRFRGPGTDLTVGLADGHVWKGGQSVTGEGQAFVANLPTEEVFTAPHRDRVDGTVRASLPLAYGGRLIEGFELRFEGGRVVEARAERGQDVLDRILDADDGARRLGEVALVSVDSPIYRTGILFFDTLFDENAASHVALGEAYRFSVDGGTAMSDDEAAAAGLNDSLMHVDFMIGSDAMDVDGLDATGEARPVMRAGRFVI